MEVRLKGASPTEKHSNLPRRWVPPRALPHGVEFTHKVNTSRIRWTTYFPIFIWRYLQVGSLGVFTVLHEFSSTDGTNPEVTLLQHTDGVLYGETYGGGKFGRGTIFTWNGGSLLHPFVAPLPNFGKIGTSIGILGKGFTGTNRGFVQRICREVRICIRHLLDRDHSHYNGDGGVVSLTTPTGVLNSEKSFIVLPSITSFTPTSGK